MIAWESRDDARNGEIPSMIYERLASKDVVKKQLKFIKTITTRLDPGLSPQVLTPGNDVWEVKESSERYQRL